MNTVQQSLGASSGPLQSGAPSSHSYSQQMQSNPHILHSRINPSIERSMVKSYVEGDGKEVEKEEEVIECSVITMWCPF